MAVSPDDELEEVNYDDLNPISARCDPFSDPGRRYLIANAAQKRNAQILAARAAQAQRAVTQGTENSCSGEAAARQTETALRLSPADNEVAPSPEDAHGLVAESDGHIEVQPAPLDPVDTAEIVRCEGEEAKDEADPDALPNEGRNPEGDDTVDSEGGAKAHDCVRADALSSAYSAPFLPATRNVSMGSNPAHTTVLRPRGKPFAKGKSGNPKGRPRGSRNKATLMVEAMFDGDAPVVAQKALELANAGDAKMINLVLSRVVPPKREATVFVDIPALDSPTACRIAKAMFAEAAAAGSISSPEAARQISIVDAVERSFHGLDFEIHFDARMADLEMSRLLAKHPRCSDPEVAARRYFAFEDELRALNLSRRQSDRLLQEYYDGLSRKAREIIDAVESEE